jgi:glucose/arabinose dehydrogenase
MINERRGSRYGLAAPAYSAAVLRNLDRVRGIAAVAFACSFLIAAGPALATPPSAPTITEPKANGALVNPADVHMEAPGFSDANGNTHVCSDWQIWTAAPVELVWQAPCAGGVEKIHIHLGDGTFTNSYAGRSELNFDTGYRLRVRFKDSAGELSGWSERPFTTTPAGPPGQPGAVPWAARQPGYVVELVASGLQLPVNIAMVPRPGSRPGDPFMYITELYGTIKVITRAGAVRDYATNLLNFNPTGAFPGSGEQGVSGIVVEPASGDVFASMVYEDSGSTADPKPHYPKVVRFHSTDGGLTAATQTTILDMVGETQGQSHLVSNLTIGPDGRLYVHNGDGFTAATALNLNSFRGKVLRMNLNGSASPGNPFYNTADGITARDYLFAYGFRNPFGGAWRVADGSHYEVENGPTVDRFAKVVSGGNYGFNGTDSSMQTSALYNWTPAHAPVNIAFVEPAPAFGSGFPIDKMDHAFVTESGPTYATGPQALGKRVVEFVPRADGTFNGSVPITLIEYTGTGKATSAGLAAGSDGLYFTDLYKDLGATSPIDAGANLLRVTYVAPPRSNAVDTVAPTIRGFAMRRTRFRVSPRRTSLGAARRRAKAGSGFRYRLSEAARVRIAIERRALGRRVGGRCRRTRKSLPRKRRCVRYLRVGMLRRAAKAGRNRHAFSGRLGRRAIRPGRYRATIRATDSTGNRSSPRRARFRIVRR